MNKFSALSGGFCKWFVSFAHSSYLFLSVHFLHTHTGAADALFTDISQGVSTCLHSDPTPTKRFKHVFSDSELCRRKGLHGATFSSSFPDPLLCVHFKESQMPLDELDNVPLRKRKCRLPLLFFSVKYSVKWLSNCPPMTFTIFLTRILIDYVFSI